VQCAGSTASLFDFRLKVSYALLLVSAANLTSNLYQLTLESTLRFMFCQRLRRRLFDASYACFVNVAGLVPKIPVEPPNWLPGG